MKTTFVSAMLAGAAAAWLSSPAQAAIIVGSITTSTPYTGIPGTINFDAGVKDAPTGFSWSGGGQVLSSTSAIGARPLGDTSPFYLSVLGGQTATLTDNVAVTGGALESLSLFIGSVDTYNSITFNAGALSQTISGTELLNRIAPGNAVNSGNQTSPAANRYFSFAFLRGVDQIIFSSGRNSLEIDDLNALTKEGLEGGGSPTPEPGAWLLLLTGFGLLGLALRGWRMKWRALPTGTDH